MRLICHSFFLQQDKNPKHCSRVAKNDLNETAEEGVLELMSWPPQSPDLNVIEHIWDYLDRKKVEHAPRNTEECFEVLQRELHNIPEDFIFSL